MYCKYKGLTFDGFETIDIEDGTENIVRDDDPSNSMYITEDYSAENDSSPVLSNKISKDSSQFQSNWHYNDQESIK